MPPRTPTPAPAASTALALPDDIRNDLLRAQADQIDSFQRLPRIKIMPQGVGLFELPDGETVREITGVLLNSHPRNILWDRPFGAEVSEDEQAPACAANDGRFGSPRPGFAHMALGDNLQRREAGRTDFVLANGTERVDCSTCPYNQWGSKHLNPGYTGPAEAKGKAVINQKALYLMLPDQELPNELFLPPTSLRNYDQYLAQLLNRGVPVQAVVTKLTLERQERGTLRWSMVKFDKIDDLSADAFGIVMEKRRQYQQQITPQQIDYSQYDIPEEEAGARDGADDEALPF